MTNNKQHVPSETVDIFLSDGKIIRGQRGAAVEDFLKPLSDEHNPTIAAVINDELRELTTPIKFEARVTPVRLSDTDGARIYRRSLTFLLEMAFGDCFPGATLTIDHSLASGGYFCQISNREPLNPTELLTLKEHMLKLVASDLPFVRAEVPLQEAIAYFQKNGYADKVHLLAHRQKDYLTIYRFGERMDYHHGYMVPSTGYLRWFDLRSINGSFVLHFPRRHKPTEMESLPQYPKLLFTFRQYGNWLECLGIDNVGALDDAIQSGRSQEIILVSEALHEQHVADIARQITEHSEPPRVVLVSGPSSSGKTTFSRRLTVQLLARGISPFPLELDNYFIDRHKTPRDRDGNLDFENLSALNLEQLAKDLAKLVDGESVQLPRYDFKTGSSQPGEFIQLEKGQLIILEGIHGLNPRLIPASLSGKAFRIYVSALTQLNLDRHNRVSTTDTRLIRRIVRDARERGYSARETISRWESVRRGEKMHIFPYQENADAMFNSALVYELSALKPFAEPLLRQVPHGTPEAIEARRLLAFLEWFLPIESNIVPDNSLAREFIGGSVLKNFKVWRNAGK